MSASPPIAVKHWHRSETPLRASSGHCRRPPNGIYGISGSEGSASFRLDIGGLYYLAPFLGFVGDQLAELGRRSRQRRAAQGGEAGLPLRGVQSPGGLPCWPVSGLGPPWPSVRRGRTNYSPRSPARTHPRSGCPAARPSASRWLLRAHAACQPRCTLSMRQWWEHNLDLPSEQIIERRPATTIGHVNHVDAAIILNTSPVRWVDVPVPADA